MLENFILLPNLLKICYLLYQFSSSVKELPTSAKCQVLSTALEVSSWIYDYVLYSIQCVVLTLMHLVYFSFVYFVV